MSNAARLVLSAAMLCALAACARPLSPQEEAFAGALFGETLDTSGISVRTGLGITPLPRPEKPSERAPLPVSALPPDLCVREPQKVPFGTWPAAFVLNEDIFFSYRYYRADTFGGWPEAVPLPAALIMAHELVHVWQWQNRDVTGYAPMKAAAESRGPGDPYYWPEAGPDAGGFLSFGFEQQAAMVEDFTCYALFDPEDPKLAELSSILAPYFPVESFLRQIR